MPDFKSLVSSDKFKQDVEQLKKLANITQEQLFKVAMEDTSYLKDCGVTPWVEDKRARIHRGSLSDSMATCEQINDKSELVKYLAKHGCIWTHPHIREYDNEPDERIGWRRTYSISVPSGHLMGDGLAIIGFCNFSEEELANSSELKIHKEEIEPCQ